MVALQSLSILYIKFRCFFLKAVFQFKHELVDWNHIACVIQKVKQNYHNMEVEARIGFLNYHYISSVAKTMYPFLLQFVTFIVWNERRRNIWCQWIIFIPTLHSSQSVLILPWCCSRPPTPATPFIQLGKPHIIEWIWLWHDHSYLGANEILWK